MTHGLGWMIVALAAGAGAAGLIAYAILDAIFGKTYMQRRISLLSQFTVGPPPPKEPAFAALRALGSDLVERVPLLLRYAARAEPMLDRINTTTTPAEWLALRLAAGLVTGLVLALFTGSWGLLGGAVAGFVSPAVVLRRRVNRRERQFADELPNTLQLVLSSLRSGFTLQQAIEAAVRDDEGPVAEELGRAVSEARLNGDFEDALERVGERIRSMEVSWLVMAIRLQREVGGSLAEVMQTTSDTMRERAYLRRHVRALSAEGRFSAYILTAMPIVTGGMMVISRPEYISPLFTDPIGIAMVAGTAVLMVVGGFWLRSSVKIEI